MQRRVRRRPPHCDTDTLNALCRVAASRLDVLLHDLCVDLAPESGKLVGCCPIHGGRSSQAFTLYPHGFEVRGYWTCRSKHCHNFFPRSLVGFVRGVLSHDEYGWSPEDGGKTVGTVEAMRRICSALSLDPRSLKVDAAAAERRRLDGQIEGWSQSPPTVRPFCTPGDIARLCEVPSPYYLGRGFSPDVLREYEVGTVTHRRSPLRGRVLIPVRDEKGRLIVGAISRSTLPKCESCGLCHSPSASCPELRKPHLRWRTEGDFLDKLHVYGLAAAAASARATRQVVVVESASDVWRLREAGVRNAVALFGSEPRDAQAILVQSLLPRDLVVLTDSDQAGEAAYAAIATSWRFTNVRRLRPPDGVKDVSDISASEVRRLLVPEITRCP